MSYEHLVGRLVETQRSLLGQRAIDIAQSIEGLTVTDDGTVASMTGDRRAVVERLVDSYVSVLGAPAEQRLRSAATEFEAEVVLPENLGGPTEAPADTTEEAAGTVEDAGDGTTGQQIDRPKSTETVVEYSTPSNTTLTGDLDTADDLASVYVIAEDQNGWEWRLTVEDAVLNAVTSATELSVEDVGTLRDYVDATVVEAALRSEGAVSFSFEIEGHHVTLQPDGNVRIE
ncbi:HalOD1 output domain-containing protein [Halomicroarcula sp. GCM10025709]|uniref:HalOD1 output domain-containing protein n=1 Tax=Haloarcula TaxID=2237 RepID=UPI0024C2F503|nr:HalOD1 output domain-containing protein [Halomicroarcula sp. YJ-61-S]